MITVYVDEKIREIDDPLVFVRFANGWAIGNGFGIRFVKGDSLLNGDLELLELNSAFSAYCKMQGTRWNRITRHQTTARNRIDDSDCIQSAERN